MAEVREPGGLGYKIFTILGIVFLLVVVAASIRTYDNDRDNASEVATGAPVVTTPAASASVERAAEAPLGAVATGGGGMAGDGPSLTMPVFVGLAALTMLATAGIVLRRQQA